MKTCLIVDDSRVIRKVARQILESMGFACEEAADGQAALNRLQEGVQFDLVLLDWNMPVMNGLDFMRALRQLPGGDAPAVIFCTTENDMAHIQEAMSAGANEYIMKPFDADIIRGKLAQLELLES